MHTVCELSSFQKAADEVGMTEPQVRALTNYLSENPLAGDLIVETGGCRKLRWAGKGKGKSGGYRIITFFSGTDIPVFLMTVFAKGERANLSQAERVGLGAITKQIVSEYRKRVVKVVGAR